MDLVVYLRVAVVIVGPEDPQLDIRCGSRGLPPALDLQAWPPTPPSRHARLSRGTTRSDLTRARQLALYCQRVVPFNTPVLSEPTSRILAA